MNYKYELYYGSILIKEFFQQEEFFNYLIQKGIKFAVEKNDDNQYVLVFYEPNYRCEIFVI